MSDCEVTKVSTGCQTEDKGNIGSGPCLDQVGTPCYPQGVVGSRGNLSRARRQGMSTGRSLSVRLKSKVCTESNASSALMELTGNSAVQPQQKTMCGKKQPELENLSNTENVHSNGTPVPIGRKSKRKPNQGIWMPFRLMFSFDITELSLPSQRTIVRRLLSSAELVSFGVQLELAKVIEPGMKQVKARILRILGRNFGVGTLAKEIVLSMSSEEGSMLLICLDGLIDTRVMWKLKEVQEPCELNNIGSPPTYTQVPGTPNSMNSQSQPF